MDIGVHAILLMPDHPHACQDFYRDTRGFEVRHDAGCGGRHVITVGPGGQPGAPVSGLPAHR